MENCVFREERNRRTTSTYASNVANNVRPSLFDDAGFCLGVSRMTTFRGPEGSNDQAMARRVLFGTLCLFSFFVICSLFFWTFEGEDSADEDSSGENDSVS